MPPTGRESRRTLSGPGSDRRNRLPGALLQRLNETFGDPSRPCVSTAARQGMSWSDYSSMLVSGRPTDRRAALPASTDLFAGAGPGLHPTTGTTTDSSHRSPPNRLQQAVVTALLDDACPRFAAEETSPTQIGSQPHD